MTSGEQQRIVLVDDLRSFLDGRAAVVARTSAAGIEAVERHRGQRLDELWLDHDLGGADTIWPVVEVLERAAFEGRCHQCASRRVAAARTSSSSR